ncbi:MAG TPA: hypothetical protein VFC19_38640 [Candidatus Limnocylindrales bacterium]|nr:hypothetical protein [Candidatus Limnocylindrales bacterium]
MFFWSAAFTGGVPVEVTYERYFIAAGEVVVPLDTGAGERGPGADRNEDVAGAAAGEGDDVVAAVPVEVAASGDRAVAVDGVGR